MKKSVFQLSGLNAAAGTGECIFFFDVYYIYGGTKYD